MTVTGCHTTYFVCRYVILFHVHQYSTVAQCISPTAASLVLVGKVVEPLLFRRLIHCRVIDFIAEHVRFRTGAFRPERLRERDPVSHEVHCRIC